MLSLLPEPGASPWQPSSAHSPASTASSAMSPVPWSGMHHETEAPGGSAPAAMQTPFQHALHRTGSLQVDASSRGVSPLPCVPACVTMKSMHRPCTGIFHSHQAENPGCCFPAH